MKAAPIPSGPHPNFTLHRRQRGKPVCCPARTRARAALLRALLVVPLAGTGGPSAAAGEPVVIASDTTVGETDVAFEGQDIEVWGATLTLNGTHAFRSLVLANGAVLTHAPCTAAATHRLDLTVSEAIVVAGDARIDASARGYSEGRTVGNATAGASTGNSGGSYGGWGGVGFWNAVSNVTILEQGAGATNAAYGHYANPGDWGSSGHGATGFTAGGGWIRLVARTLQLDGQILADGLSATNAPCGGGSGGSIDIRVDTLAGSGSIRAAGGDGWSTFPFVIGTNRYAGGGGGGRIAVYAGDSIRFAPDRIVAPGGWALRAGIQGSVAGNMGGSGTVYLRNPREARGLLRIEGLPSMGAGPTPLGLPGETTGLIPDALFVGRNAQARLEHDGMSMRIEGLVTLTNYGRIEIRGSLIAREHIEVRGRGRLLGGRIEAPSLRVADAGQVRGLDPTASRVEKLELEVHGTLEVASSGQIEAGYSGYVAGRTTGNTPVGASTGRSGGSYGGLGAACEGLPNDVYGSFFDPDDFGSGGAVDCVLPWGSGGGGLVRIRAETLKLDGYITADGDTPSRSCLDWNRDNGGGGAGGGVCIVVTNLVGRGFIGASGGQPARSWPQGGGGGGGGRVAIYAADLSRSDIEIVVNGGGRNPAGEPGTVYIAEGRPPTTVAARRPTGRRGRIAEPIDRVVLEFTRPLNAAMLNAAAFTVEGPGVSRTASGLVALSDRAYELTFARLSADGQYTFTLQPGWVDAEGFPLDLDGDGTLTDAGQQEYRFSLLLDTMAPRITHSQSLRGPAGELQAVDIWFSESIDPASLSGADLVLTNTLGLAIAVTNIQEAGLNRFRLSFPWQTAPATYGLLIGAQVRDLAGNALDQDRDGRPGELADDVFTGSYSTMTVDLQPLNVASSTNVLWANDAVTVTWTGTNHAATPLLGQWTDGVYLSPDDRWDIHDRRLGTAPNPGGVAAHGTYSNSATVVVAGLMPGNYYLLVRADIDNEAYELDGEANNTAALGPLPVLIPPLDLNASSTAGLLTPDWNEAWYVMTVPGGTTFALVLNGRSQKGVAELYARAGAVPTRLEFDARATKDRLQPDRDNLELTLTAPAEGATYYVLVYGEQIDGSIPFDILALSGAVFVSSVTPRHWGNLGPADLLLEGAGFDANTRVELVDPQGRVKSATALEALSNSRLHAQLDLTGWTPGSYRLRVIQGGTVSELPDAFDVSLAGKARLVTRVEVPERVGAGMPIVQRFYLEYQNAGNLPMPAPAFQLEASQAARLSTDPEAFRWQQGYGTIPGVSNKVAMMGYGSGPKPWLLQPGESGRIPIYYLGLEQRPAGRRLDVSFGAVEAGDERRIDWQEQERFVRQSGGPAERWSRSYRKIQDRIGGSWGQYGRELAAAHEWLAPENRRPRNLDPAFRVLARQALGVGGSGLAGTVRNATNAAPIADTEVIARMEIPSAHSVIRTARTDAAGRFNFTRLPPGPYRIQVSGYHAAEPPTYRVPDDRTVSGVIVRVLPAGPPEPGRPNESEPVLTLDDSGAAHLVWRRGTELWHARRSGNGWIGATSLPSPSGFEARIAGSPRLINGTSPGLLTTWRVTETNRSRLVYSVGKPSHRPGGFEWSQPRTLSGEAPVENQHLAGLIQPSGEVLWVWQKLKAVGTDDTDLYYATFALTSAGLAWPAPQPDESEARGSAGLAGAAPAGGSQCVGLNYTLWDFEFHGKYKGALRATICQALAGCEAEVTGGGEVELSFGNVRANGAAAAKWTWNAQCVDGVCEYAPDEMEASGSAMVSLDVPGIIGKFGIVEYEMGNVFQGGVAGSFKWKGHNFNSWPYEGSGSGTFGLGPYGKASLEIPGTGIEAEGRISGVGSFTLFYFLVANRWAYQFAFTFTVDASAGPFSYQYVWQEKWPNFAAGTAGQPGAQFSLQLDPLLGTPTVHDGKPVLADVASSLRNDGAPALAAVPGGPTLLAWTRDSEAPADWLGSWVAVATWNGAGWDAPVEIPGSRGFNSDVQLEVDPAGQAVAVWSMASSDGLTSNSTLDEVRAAMATNNLVYSIRSGGTWTAPQTVADLPGSDRSPRAGRSADGKLVLTWVNDPGGSATLYAAVWDGSHWTTPQSVAAGRFVRSAAVGSLDGSTRLLWTREEEETPESPTRRLRMFWCAIDTGSGQCSSPSPLDPVPEESQMASTTRVTGPRLASASPMSSLPYPPDTCCDCDGATGPLDIATDPSEDSTIVTSLDPNDKLGPAGYGEASFLQLGGTLMYEIRFENQARATAPARQIVITDVLDTNLDLDTFELFEIAFGLNTLSIPPGLDRYETLVPTWTGGNSILVDVQAALDYPTRTLTVTLTAVDPLTGWPPEDPLVGLLYPNDATRRGEGHILYFISPQADVKTGTPIENRARIVFDYNDPIDTPLAFNTIDAGAPASRVDPLPPESGRAFVVRWSGQDDLGGAGLATYDIYVSANGADFARWKTGTTATRAVFTAQPGATYRFFSVARDWVGNEEPAPATPDASAAVPVDAPQLLAVPNRVVEVGETLLLTNTVVGIPHGAFAFALDQPAPAGASLNPTNGVFRWTPDCRFGSSTYLFTVWATDTGAPNLSDAASFAVTVRECVTPKLGTVVVRSGDSVRVPLDLVSSVPLTNLTMLLHLPAERLTLARLDGVATDLCAFDAQPGEGDAYRLSFAACHSPWLVGTQQLAWLTLGAAAGQPSASVPLEVDDLVGRQPDGTQVTNLFGSAGRIIVVGEAPWIEAAYDTNQQPTLFLYAPTGAQVVLEASPRIGTATAWEAGPAFTMTNLWREIPLTILQPQRYYRARRQ